MAGYQPPPQTPPTPRLGYNFHDLANEQISIINTLRVIAILCCKFPDSSIFAWLL